MKKFVEVLSVLFAVVLVGCTNSDNGSGNKPSVKKSIVLLYEHDAHCNIDGYTKLRGLRDAIVQADTSYVGIVSSGDYLQGDLAGAISKGQYIVDIMRNVGYDAVTLGNHEFDYGTPRMLELLPKIRTNIVSANFYAYGATKPVYQPYVIKQYGDKRIAFVGVTTPEAMRSEAYAFFDKDGNQLYDLRTDDIYTLVQTAVDDARSEGADYVVVLSHLGEADIDEHITSGGLIKATNGIDVLLDGHTHSVIPCAYVVNKDGVEVPTSQTGAQFANYGKLWISKDGTFHTSLIESADNPYSNSQVTATADSIHALLDKETSREVATSDFDLLVKDSKGMWTVRCMETSMGNLVADALADIIKADIGLINGGGLRNNFKAGVINYGHVVSVLPFDNYVCKIAAKGQDIMAMLTKSTAICPEMDGFFPQVSGMKYTIHTKSHTVTDVQVLNSTTETYEPLDLNKEYTIATVDYYASGCFYDTLKECKLFVQTDTLIRDILDKYLSTTLKGKISEDYRNPRGLITIVED